MKQPPKVGEQFQRYVAQPTRISFAWVRYVFLSLVILIVVFGVLTFTGLWMDDASELGYFGLLANEVGDFFSPVAEPVGKGVAKLSDLMNLETALDTYSLTSDVEEFENMEHLGVDIIEFEQIDDQLEGRPVQLQGYIKATAMEDFLELSASCELDNAANYGHLTVPAFLSATVVSPEGTKAKLYKGVTEEIFFECTFPDGIKIEKKVNSAQAKIRVNYEYITKAKYTAYFMNGEDLEGYLSTGKDPFEEFGINDPQLNSDNTVTSKTTPGPMNFAVGIEKVRQPLREMRPYSIAVKLSQGFSRGYIKTLEYLHLKVSPYVYIASDNEYSQFSSPGQAGLDADICDFEPTGELDDYGYKVYKLKSDRVAYINQDCSKKETDYWGITEEECLNKFKSTIIGRCKFILTEDIPQATGPAADFITAKTKFIHEVTDTETVRVDKMPDRSSILA